MTIEKGRPWGRHGQLPEGAPVVHDDAELRDLVEAARRAGERPPVVGLAGGDLCRTVGGRGDVDRMRSPEAMELPVDVASVLVDGVQHWFTSHLVARGTSWWSGRVVAIMNAQWLGSWDVAPKSHPNDGLLDVLDSDLSIDDRLKARRRLPSGTHVPHPRIHQRRVSAATFELGKPSVIYLDGRRVGTARFLAVRVEPDALTCIV